MGQVLFEEPKGTAPRDAAWESGQESSQETAVNTAAPSRALSILGEDVEEGHDNGVPADVLEKQLTQAGTSFICVDPITHVVGWSGPEDKENPTNFSRAKKWHMTMVTAMMTFCVSFASSVFSTATTVTAIEFGVSLEVMILGVSLYVLGFACGMYMHYIKSSCS